MDNRTIEQVRKNETKLINEIKDLEQQCKKQKEVVDKARNNLEKDISMIKTIPMRKKEIITRLEITNKILRGVSE